MSGKPDEHPMFDVKDSDVVLLKDNTTTNAQLLIAENTRKIVAKGNLAGSGKTANSSSIRKIVVWSVGFVTAIAVTVIAHFIIKAVG